MKMMNRKGDSQTIWIIIFIVLALLVLIILAFWFSRSVQEGSQSTTALSSCEGGIMGSGGVCVTQYELENKEDEGYTCTKAIGGCDDTEWCCYKVI